MNKKIARIATFFVSLFLATPVLAAQLYNPLKYNDFSSLITNGIIPAVSEIIGALATIMIIVAGILYLTSAGSPEKIATAKKTLIYAIIGIAVAITAAGIASIVKEAMGA